MIASAMLAGNVLSHRVRRASHPRGQCFLQISARLQGPIYLLISVAIQLWQCREASPNFSQRLYRAGSNPRQTHNDISTTSFAGLVLPLCQWQADTCQLKTPTTCARSARQTYESNATGIDKLCICHLSEEAGALEITTQP